MKRLIAVTTMAAGLAGFAATTHAQMKPEDAIKYRKAVMQTQRGSMGPMAQMVKGAVPFDKDVFLKHASVIAATSHVVVDGFTPGSDKGETKAKPEIWSDAAKYKQAAEALQGASAKLVDAARGGNLEAVRGAFGPVVKSCDGCHDNFRSK